MTAGIRALRESWRGMALFVACLIPAFWGLSGGEIAPWDEGLAARHTFNALEYGRWLTPTSDNGSFSRAFSKPPFLLWQTALGVKLFGASAFGLRFGTALALVGTALVARGLARQIGLSEYVALSWAGLILTCGGALRWGRNINIEITLVFFVLLSLYYYARALSRARGFFGWALAAGLALIGAFLTKQVVCAMAAIPIVVVELMRLPNRPSRYWRPMVLRLLTAGGLALVAAGAWSLFSYNESAGRIVKSMVDFTVVQRVKGLGGGQHVNFLNRVQQHLTEGAAPFSWEFGAIGWGLLLWRKWAERPPALWLILVNLLTAIIVFEMFTHSILPWYTWSILVPLLLGLAYILGRAIEYVTGWLRLAVVCGGSEARRAFRPPPLELGLGWAAVSMATLSLWQSRASRVELMLLGVAWLLVGLWSLSVFESQRLRLVAALGLAILPATALAGGMALRHAYDRDPGALLSLAGPLSGAGIDRIAVQHKVAGHKNRYRGVFGSRAFSVKAPPWKTKKRADAYIETLQLPTEYQPPKGVELHRSIGLVAWVGELSRPPLRGDAMAKLLEKGKLTYEAENGSAKIGGSINRRGGVTVRSAEGRSRNAYHPVKRNLVEVKTSKLPAGEYIVRARVAARCAVERREGVGRFIVQSRQGRKQSLSISCRKQGFHSVERTMKLKARGALRMTLSYTSGDLWVDHITVERKPGSSVKARTRGGKRPHKKTKRK